MDIPTRVGLGGTALFTLAGIGSPIFTWWLSGPVMGVCALVAGWGFWPLLSDYVLWPYKQGRVPVTEVLKRARSWDFVSHNSLHLLDMQDAMRQGGIDGVLTIWGRLKKWDSDELMRSEPLQKIEPNHWKNYAVDLLATRSGDNLNTKTWLQVGGAGDIGRPGYVDLYVENKDASRWLKRDAIAFRGKTKLR